MAHDDPLSGLEALAARYDWSEDELAAVQRWATNVLAATRDPSERETQLGATRVPDGGTGPALPVDRFELRAALGGGAQGEVWRVWDRGLRRSLALKTVRPDRDSGGALARFVAEAQVTSQLQHPAIVPVHELGHLPDGRLYYTMREVRGFTLAHVVRSLHAASGQHWGTTEDGWSLQWVLERFAVACEAVGYAHSRGVAHRDLKPTNVMIGAFGEVQVLDWGVAKLLGAPTAEPVDTGPASEDSAETRLGEVVGTPAYMAPEQAYGWNDRVDARSDVYALGAILYEILSGRPAYAPEPGRPVLSQVLEGPPQPLGRRPPPPVELASLCTAAMARDRAERPEDGGALADAVRSWLKRGRAS